MKEDGILAKRIYESRKQMGVTQEVLAEKLGITPQSISRWENGQSRPDVDMLPKLAALFGITIDALFGYHAENLKIDQYEEKCKQTAKYCWSSNIKRIAREVLGLLPPDKPRTVLDIGCSDGKTDVFFARNGYIVSAFDISRDAICRAENLAREIGVSVNFFCADVNTYKIESEFDIICSSGAIQHIPPANRKNFFEMIQANTAVGGLNVMNAIVEKSFLGEAPDCNSGKNFYQSAELFSYYGRNWKFEIMDELYFDRNVSGVNHQHCIDIMIARKISD